MLEGVLKEKERHRHSLAKGVSILGMLEGVLKVIPAITADVVEDKFQSLVCWRGC